MLVVIEECITLFYEMVQYVIYGAIMLKKIKTFGMYISSSFIFSLVLQSLLKKNEEDTSKQVIGVDLTI